MLEEFRIVRCIAHKVSAKGGTVVYGNGILDLGEVEQILRDRLINALGNASYSIPMEFELVEESSTYNKIASYCASQRAPDEFIALSKSLAEKLQSVSTNPFVRAGLFVLVEGTSGEAGSRVPVIVCIKAEVQDGFVEAEEDGRIKIQHLKNLFLTPAQDMYKVASFEPDSPSATALRPDQFMIQMYDHQRNDSGVSKYFGTTFLGVKPSANAKVYTRNFFEATKSFACESPLLQSEDERMRLSTHIQSALLDASENINVEEFAQRCVPESARATFIQTISAATDGILSFDKDTTMIKTKLKQRKYIFECNASFTIPFDLKDKVEVTFEEDKTIFTIDAKLRNY